MKANGILASCPLFAGLAKEEIEQLLQHFGALTRCFEKDETVLHMGETTHRLGIVLQGGANVVRYDVWGNQSILDHVGPGQVFAETYACLPGEPLTVSVVTAETSRILFLELSRVLEGCPHNCGFHSTLLQNLLAVMARKNLNLTRKMNHITPRTIRERVLSYLSYEALRQQSHCFAIPFDRQQLADYLAVDRSALSAELSKLQKEGLIAYKKNQFILYTQAEI